MLGGWLAVDAKRSTSQRRKCGPCCLQCTPLMHTEADATMVPWTQLGEETQTFPINAKENGRVLGAYWHRTDRVVSQRDIDGQSDSIVALDSRFISLLCDCRMLCWRKVDGVGLVLRIWRIRGDPAESDQFHALINCAWMLSRVPSASVLVLIILFIFLCSQMQSKNFIRWPLCRYFTLQCHFWWGEWKRRWLISTNQDSALFDVTRTSNRFPLRLV